MPLVTKRYGKALKLSLTVIVLCLLFFGTSKYMDESLSVSEYGEYLKSSLELATKNSPNRNPTGKSLSEQALLNDKLRIETEKSLKLKKFYEQVFQYIKDYSPAGKTAREYSKACPLASDVGFRPENYPEWSKLTGEGLADCLVVSPSETAMLKENHANYVEVLGSLILPKNTYKGQGIVTVGGGKFSVMALLIIQTLRNLKTNLPVEVFIPPSDEGETELCDVVLPNYNAKCTYLSDILPASAAEGFEFTGYQFKSLALIASTFEDVLFLDADNFPVKPLDNIFKEDPYKSTGFVLWPDFWRRTTQPVYYEIADIPINKKKRLRNCFDDLTPPEVYTKDMNDLSTVPFHDLEGTIPDVSTESGQLMISKSKHLPTILLALYYNVNGPTWFYPMFSQRAAGEGDKETFLAAANFYGLPYYQVKTATGVEGYHKPDGSGFRGVAMLQHDVIQDYARYDAASKAIQSHYGKKNSIKYDKSYTLDKFYKTYFGGEDAKSIDEVDVMFAHSHAPKFDPYDLWQNNELVYQGKHVRSYTALGKINYYDLELENFKAIQEHVCINRISFKYLTQAIKKEEDWTSMCKYVSERLSYLESTHVNAVSPS